MKKTIFLLLALIAIGKFGPAFSSEIVSDNQAAQWRQYRNHEKKYLGTAVRWKVKAFQPPMPGLDPGWYSIVCKFEDSSGTWRFVSVRYKDSMVTPYEEDTLIVKGSFQGVIHGMMGIYVLVTADSVEDLGDQN